MSEIVPIAAMSKNFKYSFSGNFQSVAKACINLKATPQPANWLKGYLLSFLFASITAIHFGISSPGS